MYCILALRFRFRVLFRFFRHEEPPNTKHRHQRRQDGQLPEEATDEERGGEDGDTQLWETHEGCKRQNR